MWPNRALLQARLLIEGGYNEKALVLLQGIAKGQLQGAADRSEYCFRLGRVYEELARKPGGGQYFKQALAQYREAMKEGAGRREQYAARAALHMGKIYETLNLPAEALAMYNECLNMPDHDFQNSIDQQAKSGINRVEGNSSTGHQ
jgi:tetratricopeptide (TPR) repeat protein